MEKNDWKRFVRVSKDAPLPALAYYMDIMIAFLFGDNPIAEHFITKEFLENFYYLVAVDDQQTGRVYLEIITPPVDPIVVEKILHLVKKGGP